MGHKKQGFDLIYNNKKNHMSSSDAFEKNYAILNPEQRDAVETVYGPVMVVAWPGTWKTQIIWLRTANIITKTWVNPENILITTFTDAWVIAIKKRLLDFIWEAAYKVNVVTIHWFAEEVIKTFPEKFIDERAGSVIDEVDSIELYEDIFNRLLWKTSSKITTDSQLEYLTSLWDPYFYLRTVKSKIWILKQEWVTLERLDQIIKEQRELYNSELENLKDNKRIRDLEKRTAKDTEMYDKHIWKLKELAHIFKVYQEELTNRNLYDFNDMINFVLQKFATDEDLRYHYAEKFQFIMLDEFQDTNNAQNQIINHLLSVDLDISWEDNYKKENEPNIMVVWDDDQSIYRFQWANIENILGFFTLYPTTKVVVLKYNYRSLQPILDTATHLITHNGERITSRVNFIDKSLISWRKIDESTKDLLPQVVHLQSDIDEKIFVAEKLKSHDSVNYSDCAIIVRSNKEILEWTEFLQWEDIPVESKLQSNILNSSFVKFIINYLWLLIDPFFDEEKFINILLHDLVDVNNIDVYKINRALFNTNYTKKFKIKILDFLSDETELLNLELTDIDAIETFKEKFIELSSLVQWVNIVEIVKCIVEAFDIQEYISSQWTFDDLQDLFTLISYVKKFVDINKDFWSKDFLRKIELYKKYNYIIPRQVTKKISKWVQLITAHSSKWLEYDTVFIPGVNYWSWDGKRVSDLLKLPETVSWEWFQYENLEVKEITKIKKQKTLEEERRLFFVAITRAEKNLYITIPWSKDNKVLLSSSFIAQIQADDDWVLGNIITIQSEDAFIDTEIDSLREKYLKKSVTTQITNTEDTENKLKYIENFLLTYKLSPSDLNKFLEDPQVFLKEAVYKYPFVDNVFTIFWKVYHRVLELFFIEYIKNETLPELEFLVSRFEWLLKKEVLTPWEYTDLLENGKNGLTWYYETYKMQFTKPLHLEYNFRQKNIHFNGVPLTGKIDMIERGDFSNSSSQAQWWQMAFFKESINLVDFKTWSCKTLWVIKWLDKFWNKKPWYQHGKYYRQLLFYKLMCELDPEFSSQYEVWWLTLDFVEWKKEVYKKITVDYTQEDYVEFKELIQDTWAKINDLNFWKDYL